MVTCEVLKYACCLELTYWVLTTTISMYVFPVWDNSLKFSFSKKATTFETIFDLI